MTKELATKIIDGIDKYIELDDKINDAWIKFFDNLFSDSYAPIPENSHTETYIKAMEIMHEVLEEELGYYAFEAKSMDKATITIHKSNIDGKEREYDACNRDEFIEYLTNEIE